MWTTSEETLRVGELFFDCLKVNHFLLFGSFLLFSTAVPKSCILKRKHKSCLCLHSSQTRATKTLANTFRYFLPMKKNCDDKT